jgi:hypothetical protein
MRKYRKFVRVACVVLCAMAALASTIGWVRSWYMSDWLITRPTRIAYGARSWRGNLAVWTDARSKRPWYEPTRYSSTPDTETEVGTRAPGSFGTQAEPRDRPIAFPGFGYGQEAAYRYSPEHGVIGYYRWLVIPYWFLVTAFALPVCIFVIRKWNRWRKTRLRGFPIGKGPMGTETGTFRLSERRDRPLKVRQFRVAVPFGR